MKFIKTNQYSVIKRVPIGKVGALGLTPLLNTRICCIFVLCLRYACTVFKLFLYFVFTVFLLCFYCVFTVFLLCFYCVFTVFLLCFYCVFTVFLLCFYCVFTVFLLCFYCVFTVFVLILLFVCMMCLDKQMFNEKTSEKPNNKLNKTTEQIQK